MMRVIPKSFGIHCRNCGKVITIDTDDLYVETSSYDRGENCMGEEITYDVDHEIDCPFCDKD